VDAIEGTITLIGWIVRAVVWIVRWPLWLLLEAAELVDLIHDLSQRKRKGWDQEKSQQGNKIEEPPQT
jgi:hypothetical protein